MADDLVNPLVRLVQERLPWLFSEYGFKIVDYSYDARSFGNCIVILESESLRLRFVRDRGFTCAEIIARADPEKSYALDFFLPTIRGERPDIGFEGTAFLLKENWPAIVEALGPKLAETKQDYERREQQGREAFERLQRRYIKLTLRGRINKMKRTIFGRVLFLFLRWMRSPWSYGHSISSSTVRSKLLPFRGENVELVRRLRALVRREHDRLSIGRKLGKRRESAKIRHLL
jgi:hypothetical protein